MRDLHTSQRKEILDRLERPRPTVGRARVSTHLRENGWEIRHHFGGGFYSEALEVDDPTDLLAVQLAELVRVNEHAPSADEDQSHFVSVSGGRWMLNVSCARCGGFELELPFVAGDISSRFGEDDHSHRMEVELVRLWGHRVVCSIEQVPDPLGCPGCATKRFRGLAEGDEDLHQEPWLWFDIKAQSWHLWVPEMPASFDLQLPFWASNEDVGRAARRLVPSVRPFDQDLDL